MEISIHDYNTDLQMTSSNEGVYPVCTLVVGKITTFIRSYCCAFGLRSSGLRHAADHLNRFCKLMQRNLQDEFAPHIFEAIEGWDFDRIQEIGGWGCEFFVRKIPRTGKSISIALAFALRACVRAKLRARDDSSVARVGRTNLWGPSVPPPLDFLSFQDSDR